MKWEFSKSQKAKVIGRSRETIFQQDKLQYKILIDLPVHQCDQSTKTISDKDEDKEYNITSESKNKKPYFPNQRDLNNLIRDLNLNKSNAEILTSKLKQ